MTAYTGTDVQATMLVRYNVIPASKNKLLSLQAVAYK
jgi:hypothetical protein